jgi:hypothetical protein
MATTGHGREWHWKQWFSNEQESIIAGQGLERREILRAMALAAAASQFPGFHRWAFACGHVGAPPHESEPASYFLAQK